MNPDNTNGILDLWSLQSDVVISGAVVFYAHMRAVESAWMIDDISMYHGDLRGSQTLVEISRYLELPRTCIAWSS